MLELIQNWSDILIPLGIFLLILVTGYSLWRIGWSIFDRWADKTQWTGNIAVISTVKTPSFIWFVIIGLAVSLEFSPIPENWASPAGKTLWTILLLSIIWVFIRMGDRVIRIYASKVDIPGPYLMIARRSVLVLLIVVMILTALSIWGAPTNAALLGIAILVLIAFLALRDLLADIFAGLEISASGSI